MQRSESIKNVMTALGAFQGEALKITKDATNPHFKSKYASLAAILDVIQPILTKCNLVFTQVPEESTHLITMLFHTVSGEYIESRYELKAANATPQGIGSAITYARRYSLTSLLGLNIDDDDDGNAGSEQNKSNGQQQPQAPQTPQPKIDIQPAQPATPFNKKYTEIGPVIAAISTAKEIIELNTIYAYNKILIDANRAALDQLKKQKLFIENGGKIIITDKQLGQVIDRIRIGEEKVYDLAMNTYILNQQQTDQMQKAVHEYQQLNEALKIKYNNPEEILEMMKRCPTTGHITRLHQNNAMIIDRDPELTTRINARIKELKG